MKQKILFIIFILFIVFKSYSWEITFTTMTGLIITQTDPVVGANNVSPTTGKSVYFSQAMDESTLTIENLFLVDLKTMTPIKPDHITYYSSSKKASLIGFSKLSSNGNYAIVITEGVKDIYGNSLDKNMPSYTSNSAFGSVWMYEFFTGNSPEVISTLIGDISGIGTGGQENVPVDAKISISFNRNMNQSSFSAENITMKNKTNNQVIPITFSYNSSQQLLEITSTKDLEFCTTYIISLTNIQDNSGNIIP
ncbi:MAG: Ig-like domain-containing protein [bacterium]